MSVAWTNPADWDRLDALLGRIGAGRLVEGPDAIELAGLYRSVSADSARVRSAGVDPATIAYLDHLLARAHNRLYGAPPLTRTAVAAFIARDFPETVRRHATYFWLSSAAFYGTFLFGLVASVLLPDFASGVMGPQQAEMFRRMYEETPEHARSASGGGLSVSFYVQHNTSIGFRVFATGVFGGLGSAFMLLYQGLVIGATFGLLVADEKAHQLLTFTCGHSAWELTAIVLSGAAGLRLGWSFVRTEGLTRLASARAASSDVARLVSGAAIFFGIAAVIEGLWSASPIPPEVKWAFAVLQVSFVVAYLCFAGRRRGTS